MQTALSLAFLPGTCHTQLGFPVLDCPRDCGLGLPRRLWRRVPVQSDLIIADGLKAQRAALELLLKSKSFDFMPREAHWRSPLKNSMTQSDARKRQGAKLQNLASLRCLLWVSGAYKVAATLEPVANVSGGDVVDRVLYASNLNGSVTKQFQKQLNGASSSSSSSSSTTTTATTPSEASTSQTLGINVVLTGKAWHFKRSKPAPRRRSFESQWKGCLSKLWAVQGTSS